MLKASVLQAYPHWHMHDKGASRHFRVLLVGQLLVGFLKQHCVHVNINERNAFSQ
jgi:hypothetical protein